MLFLLVKSHSIHALAQARAGEMEQSIENLPANKKVHLENLQVPSQWRPLPQTRTVVLRNSTNVDLSPPHTYVNIHPATHIHKG